MLEFSAVLPAPSPYLRMGGCWRWALLSPDGVAASRIVDVSASVNLLCTIKSRNSLLAPAHLGGPRQRAVERLWCCGGLKFL